MRKRRLWVVSLVTLIALFFVSCGVIGALVVERVVGSEILTWGWSFLSFLCLTPFVAIAVDRGRLLSAVVRILPQPLLQFLISWNLSQIALTLLSGAFLTLSVRVAWFRWSPLIVTALVMGTVFRSAQRVVKREISLEFDHLPESWRDLTILHLSDVHAGPFMRPRHLERIVSRVNEEVDADLCVITGDVVNHSSHDLTWALPILEKLKSRSGIFASIGNHEYIDDETKIISLYKGSRVKLLLNSSARVVTDSGTVRLVGVDYPFENGMTHSNEVETAMGRSGSTVSEERGELDVLLSHHPNGFEAARELGIHVTLAGHTHGGQITLLGKNFIGAFVRYTRGLYSAGRSFMYVNSGLGNWLPFRVNCPCEFAVIRVIRKSSSV